MKDLQAFFPFDPYRLPDSRKWFDGMYREWGMVALDDDDDDDDDDEEGSEEEVAETNLAEGDGESDDALEASQRLKDDSSDDDEEKYGVPMEMGSVRDRGRDGLGMAESFGQMSISPIPGVIHRQMAKKLGT